MDDVRTPDLFGVTAEAVRAATGAIERYCDNLGEPVPSPALARALAREALIAAAPYLAKEEKAHVV